MKELKIYILLALFSVFMASCSDDDNVAEEPEVEYIEGAVPEGSPTGTVYAVSHDLRLGRCTFAIYLGDNPSEDVKEHFEGTRIQMNFYANEEDFGTLYDVSRTYKSGVTFTIPSYYCERCHKIEIDVKHPNGESEVFSNSFECVHQSL